MSPSNLDAYEVLYETIPDALLAADREGRIVACNGLAEQLTGHSREELLSMCVEDLVPEMMRSHHARYRELYMKQPRTREMGSRSDIWMRRRDGAEIPVDIKLSPIGPGGEAGVNCIVRDVTALWERENRLRNQARHQATLAKLGERAVASQSWQELLNEAAAGLVRALGVECCKVLQLLPEKDELLLVSGVGWKEGRVGYATVHTGTDFQAGYTLESDEPVVVADVRTETRFTLSPLLVEHHAASGMSVTIRGRRGPWGVLGVHSTRRREFGTDEVSFLQGAANLLGLVLERERGTLNGPAASPSSGRREHNQRRGLRFRLHVPVRYAGDAAGEGTMWNISRSGVRVERAPEPLPPVGADLELEFELPPDGLSFAVAGAVVRHTDEGFAVCFDPSRSNSRFYPRLLEFADIEDSTRT